MGLKFLVKEERALPQMNAVLIPEAVKAREAEVRKTLLNEFNLEIGAGLGPAGRQDLAHRPHGLFVQARERHAVPVGAGFGALRHGPADPRRRRRSGRARRLRCPARQGGATETAAESARPEARQRPVRAGQYKTATTKSPFLVYGGYVNKLRR